ncbi:MAG: zf-HC2 domain-containing protein [Deltaproteobacteria bacterium]|nr:zf-HC2 domain-containing protein [Deltaproteobacteria bacterium]
MDHDRAKELFTQYHEGDLSDEELAQLERHFDDCDECREEWETYRKTIDGVSGLLQMGAPDDFTHSVEQKIKKRSRGRFFGDQRSFSMQFAVVSFILILLFILAYLVTDIFIVGESQETSEQTSAPEKGEAGK